MVIKLINIVIKLFLQIHQIQHFIFLIFEKKIFMCDQGYIIIEQSDKH
jgi:hypothetical protein